MIKIKLEKLVGLFQKHTVNSHTDTHSHTHREKQANFVNLAEKEK